MKLRLQEYTGQLIVPDPLFALVQREAVDWSGERNIITDSDFLWTIGDANESKYPLFYMSERTAECALDRINDVALRVGCFASKTELEDYLFTCVFEFCIINHVPGENDGYLIRTRHLHEQLRAGMA